MSPQIERLAIELLGLPTESRSLLMKQLISSLKEEELPEVSDKWLQEIDRRDAEVSTGKVRCVPVEDVLYRARERVR